MLVDIGDNFSVELFVVEVQSGSLDLGSVGVVGVVVHASCREEGGTGAVRDSDIAFELGKWHLAQHSKDYRV